MAYKVFLLSNDQPVTIYKRRTARRLKLTIDGGGQVKVSIPTWAPYKTGLDFARSKESWINANYPKALVLKPAQMIGKAHHLEFKSDPSKLKPSSRLLGSTVLVTYPINQSFNEPTVQAVAHKACLKALRVQAEALLPQRLDSLARAHGLSYNSVSIRHLKSRWGSCDHQANIVLNLFLMTLPWELIDYVLLHELTHTEVLRHGPDFWGAMTKRLPGVKNVRTRLRQYQPSLQAMS